MDLIFKLSQGLNAINLKYTYYKSTVWHKF